MLFQNHSSKTMRDEKVGDKAQLGGTKKLQKLGLRKWQWGQIGGHGLERTDVSVPLTTGHDCCLDTFLLSRLSSCPKGPDCRAQAVNQPFSTSGLTPTLSPRTTQRGGGHGAPWPPIFQDLSFLVTRPSETVRGHLHLPSSAWSWSEVLWPPLSICLPLRDIIKVEWSSLGLSQIKNRTCIQPEQWFRTQHCLLPWSLATWKHQGLETSVCQQGWRGTGDQLGSGHLSLVHWR